MITTETAVNFLRAVKAFDIAMDEPSTDVEVDAACAMRDYALVVLEEGSSKAYVKALMDECEM